MEYYDQDQLLVRYYVNIQAHLYLVHVLDNFSGLGLEYMSFIHSYFQFIEDEHAATLEDTRTTVAQIMN